MAFVTFGESRKNGIRQRRAELMGNEANHRTAASTCLMLVAVRLHHGSICMTHRINPAELDRHNARLIRSILEDLSPCS